MVLILKWLILITAIFVWFDSLHPRQQFFSFVGMGLPGLNQYLARINVSCSRTTRQWRRLGSNPRPLVSSQALYHWATALPLISMVLILKWLILITAIFVCLILFTPVNNFSVMLGWVFLHWPSTKQGWMCLAKGHNAVTLVRLEPTALRPRVKPSTID